MPQQPNVREIGLTGLKRSQQGYVEEEFLPQLQGKKLIDVMTVMKDNDPVAGAVLFTIDMLLRNVKWRVEQEKEDDRKEFVEQCKDDMSSTWADFISEVFSMLPYGWSYFEVVYKKRQGDQDDLSAIPSSKYNDGKIGWRKFSIRSQDSFERWKFDDNGGVRGLIQKPAPKFEDIEIPIEKSLLFRTTTYKNNPEGRSMFRNAYRPWYFKQRIEQIEAVGIERDLAGLPFAEVDATIMMDTASDDEKKLLAQIEKVVRGVKRDENEGIVWPVAYDDNNNKLYSFSLLSSGGQRTFDTSGIIQRKSQEMAMTALADFILLGHEKVGSFALSSDKTDLFALAIGAWLNVVADVLNMFAVPRLLRLNGMKTEDAPKLVPGDIETPPLADIASYISSLAGAGMPLFPDEDLENWLREIASLPEKSEDTRQTQDGQAGRQDQVARDALATARNAAGSDGETQDFGDQ